MRALLFLITLYAPVTTLAYPDGAPPAHSGGFGEPGCSACHFSESTRHNGLSLTGLETSYQPGRTYTLLLQLQSPKTRTAGFQVSARFAKNGSQAGKLTPADNQQVKSSEGIDYLTHRPSALTNQTTDSIIWNIRWTAPDTNEPVIFHAAALAGNDDESPLGDSAYRLNAKYLSD